MFFYIIYIYFIFSFLIFFFFKLFLYFSFSFLYNSTLYITVIFFSLQLIIIVIVTMNVSPSVVTYSSPFTTTQTERVVTITNSNQFNTIAFKFKTNAPSVYSASPNNGVLPPAGSIKVYFHLKPFKLEPSKRSVCKDKFLVLSAPIHGADTKGKVDWSSIEATRKKEISTQKIKVLYKILDVEKETVDDDGASSLENSSEDLVDMSTLSDGGVTHSTSFPELQQKLNDAENIIAQLEREISQAQKSAQYSKKIIWLTNLSNLMLVSFMILMSWYLNTR